MTQEPFGGEWTETKLALLEKYLKAYVTIFKSNARAQYFETIYIDAFAGTGKIPARRRSDDHGALFVDDAEDSDAKEFLRGSASRALDLQPSFDRFIFIEQNKMKSDALRLLIEDEYSSTLQRVEIVQQDAGTYLLEWCRGMDTRSQRAVLFLDPFGMEVEWSLVEAIAKTTAIDMWMLFPLSGISRHLTNNEPPPRAWAERITRVFGTDEWLRKWYPDQMTPTLFGDEYQRFKDIDIAGITDFVVERLSTVFDPAGVVQRPLVLRNSKNVPLFLFCFATGAQKPSARGAAVRIANSLIRKI